MAKLDYSMMKVIISRVSFFSWLCSINFNVTFAGDEYFGVQHDNTSYKKIYIDSNAITKFDDAQTFEKQHLFNSTASDKKNDENTNQQQIKVKLPEDNIITTTDENTNQQQMKTSKNDDNYTASVKKNGFTSITTSSDGTFIGSLQNKKDTNIISAGASRVPPPIPPSANVEQKSYVDFSKIEDSKSQSGTPASNAKKSEQQPSIENNEVVKIKDVKQEKISSSPVNDSKTKKHSAESVETKSAGQKQTKSESEEDITIEEIILDNEVFNRPVYDYRNVVLPPAINKKHYSDNNRHLPKVFYQNEYTSLLFSAIKSDDIQGINSLLQRGANINAQDTSSGYTPLMYAVKYNRMKALRYLIVKGADINRTTINGQNALHVAVSMSNAKAIEVLLSAGINATAKDKYGRRPSDYMKSNLTNISLIMVSNYQDMNKALIDFVGLGTFEAVQRALQNGADINCHDDNGNVGDTPLMIAIRCQDVQMVSLLLNNGASLTTKNHSGQSAVAVALSVKNQDIINILRTVKINRELEEVIK